MLVENFEFNSIRRPIWAWLKAYLTPYNGTGSEINCSSGRKPALVERTRKRGGNRGLKPKWERFFYYYFFECKLRVTLTTKTSNVSLWTPLVRPKYQNYTPNEYLRYFHRGTSVGQHLISSHFLPRAQPNTSTLIEMWPLQPHGWNRRKRARIDGMIELYTMVFLSRFPRKYCKETQMSLHNKHETQHTNWLLALVLSLPCNATLGQGARFSKAPETFHLY